MSRRRKEKDPDKPKGFEPPEFDEREFIRKEMISFRAALVLLVWAIVAAGVSFVVWATLTGEGLGWYVGLLIAAGMGYMLRWILPALRVDIGHFGKKEWFGTGALFFFSWLAFFILLLNPPIYDGVPPDLEVHVTPSAQEPGGVVNITLVATDNIAVDTSSVEFQVTGPGGTIASQEDLWLAVEEDAGVWTWGFTPSQEGTYTVEVTVKDTPGGSLMGGSHRTVQNVEFTVGDVVEVRMSSGGVWNTTRDVVTVHIPAQMDVYRAYLENTREDNQTVPVYLEHDPERSDEERQEWFAEPSFDGFELGENRFRVVIEEHNSYFLEAQFEELGPMTAALVTKEEYIVQIPDQGLLGDQVPGLPNERDPTVEPIPGPAALVLVLLLLPALGWLRKRRALEG